MIRLALAGAVLAALLAGACDDAVPPDAAADLGDALQADLTVGDGEGPGVDAAPAADAAPTADTAPADDTAPVADTAPSPDTAPAPDTEPAADTTPAPDTPPIPDAAPDADAEPAADAAPDAAPDADPGPDAAPDADPAADAGPDSTPGWTPPPLPPLDEEPAPPCEEALANAWYFQFLDNLCDEKVQPSTQDRDRACPVVDEAPEMTLQDGTVVTYGPSGAAPAWDTAALADLVPPQMQLAVVLVKRVNGVPHYRWLSNGTHDEAYQPWSTTKPLAVANAASVLRIQSGYAVGLTASVGAFPLGDLVTSIASYDDDPYSSNGLGAYFHDIGGRLRANDLVHDLWLGRPAGESFGGNYGSAPAPLGYVFTEPGGASLTIVPDKTPGPANHLSSHTQVDWLRRIVLHREEPSLRLPGLQWKDIRVLLYGTEGGAKAGGWGGLTADTSLYLQAGHDIAWLEARSQGQWVIFSKLGLGTQGQFTHVGYAC